MSYDRVTQVGAAFVACTYDVDLRDISGEAAAHRILAETRARVQAGRVLRPDAAHYVNLITSGKVEEAVRAILFPALGEHDGIDGVSLSGWSSSEGRVSEGEVVSR